MLAPGALGTTGALPQAPAASPAGAAATEPAALAAPQAIPLEQVFRAAASHRSTSSLAGSTSAVLASGMEMSRFSFLVGALGVGIGFGLQNVVNNFVSGLILLYERPVQVGDVIEVGAVSGEVTRIGVRSSTVRTFPGAEVIVPNATLISTEVTNWTLSDRRRRIELGVGVAYGTPPQQVIDLLLAAVRGRAGIAIPFPQRDLHVRSLDPAAARALAAARTGSDGGAGP